MALLVNFFPAGFFIIGSHELELFRNGAKQIVTKDYEELTQTIIRLFITPASLDEINAQVRGRQVGSHPGLYFQQTELVGGSNILYTVPTYTVGNDSMRIWRNGKLLSLANGDYAELSDIGIRITGPLLINDELEFIVRGENADGTPVLFEEIVAVGGANEVFTITLGDYIIGSETLEVFRNGKKLVRDIGYTELTTTTVRHDGVGVAGDTFTFLVRAESNVFPPALAFSLLC